MPVGRVGGPDQPAQLRGAGWRDPADGDDALIRPGYVFAGPSATIAGRSGSRFIGSPACIGYSTSVSALLSDRS